MKKSKKVTLANSLIPILYLFDFKEKFVLKLTARSSRLIAHNY
jgi:hypothetical protein